MASILYFFPMNPQRVSAGNELRARTLLTYFSDRGHEVDFVSSQDYWGGVVTEEDVLALKRQGLIRNHLSLVKKPRITNAKDFFLLEIPRFVKKKLKSRTSGISNFVTDFSKKQFNAFIANKHYDYVIISYAFWTDLIRDNPNVVKSKTIIDTHDFITAQEQGTPGVQLGRAFDDEINRLNTFDAIWTVSADEQYVFSQFCQKPVLLIPICAAPDVAGTSVNNEFDLLFVGGNNPHNVNSIRWFFNEVYPRLSKSLKICVVGKITAVVPEHMNVTKVLWAEDLASYYRKSRIAICPMLSGTGTKVKVIEALAHGLPVVCSLRGVDGLLNKRENGCLVANTSEAFAEQIDLLASDMSIYLQTKAEAIAYHHKYHSLDVMYGLLDEALQR